MSKLTPQQIFNLAQQLNKTTAINHNNKIIFYCCPYDKVEYLKYFGCLIKVECSKITVQGMVSGDTSWFLYSFRSSCGCN